MKHNVKCNLAQWTFLHLDNKCYQSKSVIIVAENEYDR